MKSHDFINVYTNPDSEASFEGRAELLEKNEEISDKELEYWLVKFDDGGICYRWIKPDSKLV
jgi:arylamine N-acetyltransferase